MKKPGSKTSRTQRTAVQPDTVIPPRGGLRVSGRADAASARRTANQMNHVTFTHKSRRGKKLFGS